MLILANALTEAKEPAAFLVVMALFFTATFILGWICARIPIFKWIPLVLWGLYTYKHPHVLINWEMPACYLYWGLVGAYALYFRKKLFSGNGGGTSLSFPRMPHFGGGGFFSSIGRFLGGFFGLLWRVIRAVSYFLFIRLPVHLIRLGFWLKNILPQLRSPQGWWQLLKGLFAWMRNLIWNMLPPEFRAEFRRGMHGKTAGESYTQDIKDRLRKEQQKQKRREEEELRRVFQKMKGFFRKEAKAGRNPFEQTEQEEPEVDPHEEFQKRGYTGAEAEAEKRRMERERQARETENRRREQAKQKQQSGDDFFNEQRRKTEQSRRARQQSSTQSQKESRTSSPPPPEPKNLDPRSKAYFEKYRSDFASAKWTYSADEERFTGGKSAYEVLGVSTDATKPQIKKAYYQLARTYMEFTNPYHPTTVQARSNAIMSEINSAKMKLLGK